MTEQPPTESSKAGSPRPGTPRWVKVSAVIALLVLVLVAVLLISGRGGEHGPGRHGASGGDDDPAPLAAESRL
jgi:hypothetical protein